MMTNFYDQLGIKHNASMDEVKNAYRRLAKKYHPDVNQGDPAAEGRFKEVKEAYETLHSPLLREKYDRLLGINKQKAHVDGTQSNRSTGEMNTQGFDPAAVHQTFEQFFGFHPKSKNPTIKKGKQKKNPLDTSDLFNHYFGKR